LIPFCFSFFFFQVRALDFHDHHHHLDLHHLLTTWNVPPYLMITWSNRLAHRVSSITKTKLELSSVLLLYSFCSSTCAASLLRTLVGTQDHRAPELVALPTPPVLPSPLLPSRHHALHAPPLSLRPSSYTPPKTRTTTAAPTR
jgi:hypothetical protein